MGINFYPLGIYLWMINNSIFGNFTEFCFDLSYYKVYKLLYAILLNQQNKKFKLCIDVYLFLWITGWCKTFWAMWLVLVVSQLCQLFKYLLKFRNPLNCLANSEIMKVSFVNFFFFVNSFTSCIANTTMETWP